MHETKSCQSRVLFSFATHILFFQIQNSSKIMKLQMLCPMETFHFVTLKCTTFKVQAQKNIQYTVFLVK